MKQKKWLLPLLLILGLAAGLRGFVAFIALRAMPPVSDALSYTEEARALLDGASRAKAYYWPPGNPYWLAGWYFSLGDSLAVTRAVTVLSGVACVALMFLLASDVLRPRKSAFATAWVAACYAPAVLLSGQPYSQHLASVCLLIALWAVARALSRPRLYLFALAGAAFGAGCLTRPSTASVLPVLIVTLLIAAFKGERAGTQPRRLERRPILAAAGLILFGAAAALVLAPILAHNVKCGAGLTISTNNERNFFLGNNPYTPDYKTSHFGQRSLEELDPATRTYLTHFYQSPDPRRAMKTEALGYMRRHPLKTLYRCLNRWVAFWGFDYLASRNIQNWFRLHNRSLVPLLAVEAGSYLLVAALALLGIGCCREDLRPGAAGLLLTTVVFYELPYVIAFSGGTYHFPVVWLLMPFAATVLTRLARAVDRRDFLRRFTARPWVWVALIAFAALQLQYAYYAAQME